MVVPGGELYLPTPPSRLEANNIFFSVVYCKNSVYDHITYTICIYQLCVLLVKLLVKNRLSVVKFSGTQKLHADF